MDKSDLYVWLTSCYNQANNITVKNPPLTTDKIFAAMLFMYELGKKETQNELVDLLDDYLAAKMEESWSEQTKIDAARYRKLQMWMSSNVIEGWSVVEQLGAVAAWEGLYAMDSHLDSLDAFDVGLCKRQSTIEPEPSLVKNVNELAVQEHEETQRKTELVWSISLGKYIHIPRQPN